MFFRFVKKNACDGQMDRQRDGRTDRQNYDLQARASIAASRGNKADSHHVHSFNQSLCIESTCRRLHFWWT